MGTKETVLEMFEKNRGSYISGEKLAATLNISRTAVWKAVKKLQSEGYRISAVTNRGYCLAEDSDILSVQGIVHQLNYECRDLKPEVFVKTNSTNIICRQKANDGEPEGYVAIAGSQSNGRGRNGREFFSPAESGIYMSILLKPVGYTGIQILRLTTMAAVAVCEAIESVSDRKADIKWVNDIYMDGKKVCGILSEASYNLEMGSLDAVVVGIGINVYPPKHGFPPEIADKAGTVFEQSVVGIRNQLTAEVLNCFMKYYRSSSTDAHIEEYKRRSIVVGKDIKITRNNKVTVAHAVGLDDDCGLIVELEDGSRTTMNYGDVSIIGIKG